MGTELLTTGSILAAFFAGGVALFAPCCIVFLAPSYLAGAVKNSRWRLLPLTFVFAAGLGLVLVPITPVSYTHLRAHETRHDLVCRLLLEKKKKKKQNL